MVLPDLLFSLLNQVHQRLVEVVLSVISMRLLFNSLHILLVRGTGNVAGIVSQAHQRYLAHSALVSAIPGEGGRERAFNRSFWHCSDRVWFSFPDCRACNNALNNGSTLCYCKVKIKTRRGEYSTIPTV